MTTCASTSTGRSAIDRFTDRENRPQRIIRCPSVRSGAVGSDRIGSIGFFGRRKTVDRVCNGDDDDDGVDVELTPRVRRVASRIGREPVARYRFKRRPRPIPHPWCSPILCVFARVVSRGVSIVWMDG